MKKLNFNRPRGDYVYAPQYFRRKFVLARTSGRVEMGRRNGTRHKNLMENMTRANDFIIILGTTPSLAGPKLVTRDRNQRTRIKERLSGSKSMSPSQKFRMFIHFIILYRAWQKKIFGVFFFVERLDDDCRFSSNSLLLNSHRRGCPRIIQNVSNYSLKNTFA